MPDRRADQPRLDFTGRSLVVNTSPCPAGMSVAVPRDWARGRCSSSRNSPPVWSEPGAAQVDHDLQREHQVAVQVTVQRVPAPAPYFSRMAVDLTCPAA